MSNKNEKKLSYLKFSRKLIKFNIPFTCVESYGYNFWKVTFDKSSSTNDCLRNRYLKETEFTTYIPRYKFFRKGIIHEIPLDVSMEELMDTFKTDNPSYIIKDAHRLKKKDKVSKK